MIKITNACVGCGQCTGECPNEAIWLDYRGYANIEFDACAECKYCIDVCPMYAIEWVDTKSSPPV